MKWTVLVVILLSYIFISTVAEAESTGAVLSEKGAPDLAKVRNIVLMAETDWQNNDYIAYFEKMTNLCQRIVNRNDISTADYMLFLENISQVVLKPHTVVQPHSIAFTNYERVANMLVLNTLDSIQMTQDTYSSLRSRNTRLLMIVLSRTRAAKIPNLNPKPVFVNIEPPINPGHQQLIAGMDPADIKNPEARAAYEKALADNDKATDERSEQMAVDKILRHSVPRAEQYLVKVYSIKPFNDAELAEYMALGNFDASSTSKVIDEVHRQTGNTQDKK